MKFKQFYLGCLAHASYYIGSDGVAAIIDPQRDVQQYLDEAKANGQEIKYIIETHSHADFVSGHIELAKKTGAEIVFGRLANTEFPTRKVSDGDELMLGKLKLRFLETPGHTPEGITILAENTEDSDAPVKMFTGDTLFIGDVGRPDLVGSKGFTAEEMAGMLYDSLHAKILSLPDETEVYPAHGAGSQCGKNMSKETWSTLGNQREFNYALQPMERDEFVRLLSSDLPAPPMYFPKSAAKNLKGAASLDTLIQPERINSLDIVDFEGVLLDVRRNTDFGEAHIPNSINIGLGGQFASWAGSLIEIGTPIVVVAEIEEQIDEAVMRLARVGIETVKGGILIDEWDGQTKSVTQISVEQMNEIIREKAGEIQFVDVRRIDEFKSGHAPRAINMSLTDLNALAGNIEKDAPTYVMCLGGYRSSIGTSVLEKNGFTNLYNVLGGTSAWSKAGFEMTVPKVSTAGN